MDITSENITEEKQLFTFKKGEKLCSKILIDRIFTEGETFLSYPVKIAFVELESSPKGPVVAAFTVGKRSFKLAVQRNHIKRKIREAYRLNKHILYTGLGEKHLAVFFIYIGKEIPDYKRIDSAMKKGIDKLIDEIDPNKKT
jgi:ribonuclease P protein component